MIFFNPSIESIPLMPNLREAGPRLRLNHRAVTAGRSSVADTWVTGNVLGGHQKEWPHKPGARGTQPLSLRCLETPRKNATTTAHTAKPARRLFSQSSQPASDDTCKKQDAAPRARNRPVYLSKLEPSIRQRKFVIPGP